MTRGLVPALARLTRIERSLLVEALWLLIAVRVALRTLAFTTVRRYLARRVVSPRGGGPTPEQIARAVRAVGRRVPGTTCLAEAVVGHAMLQRHGHHAVLRIGVRRGESADLDAHAWVECEGTVPIGAVANLADYAILS
jgi:hypothetical protein